MSDRKESISDISAARLREMLTLDEAIAHAEGRSDDSPCGRNHAQLAAWLRELKVFREANVNVARLREALEVCEKAMCDYCLEAAGKNPQLAGKPCLNGCETLRLAKAALEETAAAERGGAK